MIELIKKFFGLNKKDNNGYYVYIFGKKSIVHLD